MKKTNAKMFNEIEKNVAMIIEQAKTEKRNPDFIELRREVISDVEMFQEMFHGMNTYYTIKANQWINQIVETMEA